MKCHFKNKLHSFNLQFVKQMEKMLQAAKNQMNDICLLCPKKSKWNPKFPTDVPIYPKMFGRTTNQICIMVRNIRWKLTTWQPLKNIATNYVIFHDKRPLYLAMQWEIFSHYADGQKNGILNYADVIVGFQRKSFLFHKTKKVITNT